MIAYKNANYSPYFTYKDGISILLVLLGLGYISKVLTLRKSIPRSWWFTNAIYYWE